MNENFIYERLKSLSGGNERESYRDISKAFHEIVKYNQRAVRDLEKRIDQEIKDVSERYYLYGAVAKQSDASMINDFLFPISEEKAVGSIGTVFCECSGELMEQLFSEPQKMLIETAKECFEKTVTLKRCWRYHKKIEALKQVFFENGVYWRTPNLPYVNKFADVYSEDLELEVPVLSMKLKEKEISLILDLLPFWNVEKKNLRCTIFPIPAIDEQNFEHILKLPFVEDGYLFDIDHKIKNSYYTEKSLVAITEESLQRDFDVFRVVVKRNIQIPHYPLTTNFRTMRHIDRQSDQSTVWMNSKAELFRMLNSYEVSQEIRFVNLQCNQIGSILPFDKTKEKKQKDSLLLEFQVEQENNQTKDQVSFLLTEVQRRFPQYEISGELKKL